MAPRIRLIVTSSFGLEAVVKNEVLDLGFRDVVMSDGKVEFDAEIKDIPLLNIWLRAADRVLLKLGEFPADDFGKLFDGTRALPWEDWFIQDAMITVIGKSVKSKLLSVRTCQSIVKKAIIERLKEKLSADILPETGPEFTVQVALYKDVAQLTLDTSGAGLHKRGYRTTIGEVPIRENLAAAMLLLASLDRNEPLIDPMCGSGTILIEAAMMARNIAPGLKREFASEKWPVIDKLFWDEARHAAREAISLEGPLQLFGYDIDPARIADCRVNAKRAGVDKDIVFAQQDICSLKLEAPSGTMVSNPPYGINLLKPEDLVPIYHALNNMFKDRPAWALYIITADRRFPQYFKRSQPDKIRKLFNGTLEVHYYQYYGK
ncbi:MAG: class I SAM-dependent RNA methyltransferase [Candidatus Omnitrophica bacterium]|nr:class I SAM-dependent RNA methyltransferase [Candidatus Omnitrophota bacterium]